MAGLRTLSKDKILPALEAGDWPSIVEVGDWAATRGRRRSQRRGPEQEAEVLVVVLSLLLGSASAVRGVLVG